ncbi:hypothetical protein [uncultured Lutibacter sp.]|uniref:alpha-L-rhamnosidase-related protein n=1 Tax=uncultured Lutibacter sp. TaxID=437739 RepID=UPI002609B132|nr:hypothetical protein [uncultured Lutibacter sp.]
MKYSKSSFAYLLGVIFFASCINKDNKLYQSKKFTLNESSIVQGDNIAKVISSNHIKSNYKSQENQTYSNLISFKFSINEKDNDLAQGVDRQILIKNQKESAIYSFGEPLIEEMNNEESILPVDYNFTFKLDMSPVFSQFKEKGYYQCADGSKIAKSDFKGVYIAGGALPLTWDFVNLDERKLKMSDLDKDNIYEITLILNPLLKNEEKEWKLTENLSNSAKYSSDQPIVDALYNMSLEESKLAIEPDSTFRTGAKWSGVWTRDISYSILLAFAYLEPEVAKISLLKKVKRDRIIQDTGSGGAWPISSDRTTWALAAWEIYKTTGDINWLRKVYVIIKNTVDDDYKIIRSKETGMYSGESSFLDWREQTYPKWMSNKDIYVSQNLGTNVVHYQTHIILSKMAKILGEDSFKYEKIASEIKEGINTYLWIKEEGYYAQYLYGRNFLIPSKRYEALGESLAVIFGVADNQRAKSIIQNSPLTEFGATCIYPQIPSIPPYHNNGIWPFVQSYWNLAAAKAGNEKVLNHGLASIYRAAGLYLTNYENMVADNGDFKGTEINSHRMLWSMAGNLAMVYRVFLGMQFEEDHLEFNPVIPRNYGGKRTLNNFKYRDAILNITVEGFGNKIASVYLDNEKVEKAIILGVTRGTHELKIEMMNNDFSKDGINLVDNKFSPAAPKVSLNNHNLIWNSIEGAKSYNIYKNGKLINNIDLESYSIDLQDIAEYAVSSVDKFGLESFVSEPILINKNKPVLFEIEDFVEKSALNYINFSGNGFVEFSNTKNKNFTINIPMEQSGDYYLDFKYSNGSGPWNTDNKCTSRSLYVNDNYLGAIVLPQRGLDEWSDWGYSNSYKINFKKGDNTINITFEDWNINMNVAINKAMIDYLRLIKI